MTAGRDTAISGINRSILSILLRRLLKPPNHKLVSLRTGGLGALLCSQNHQNLTNVYAGYWQYLLRPVHLGGGVIRNDAVGRPACKISESLPDVCRAAGSAAAVF